MKKTTKTLALILAVMMCFGMFAACGGDPAPTPTATVSADVTATVDVSASPEITDDAAESDYEYIKDKGKLIIGITEYEPMNYYDENGNLTGFDTEFAETVCNLMGVEPEFVEITWSAKEIELAAKTIDCIWNGMTINPTLAENLSISLPYVKNSQVVIVRSDSGITSTADLIGKTVVAEMSSAGEKQIIGDDNGEGAEENLAESNYISKTKQTDCLLEVMSGTADAAVLDWTLAMAMVGEGTDYADLMMIEGLELGAEEYGIAFRKGSDMTEMVNAAILELVDGGTLPALAEKYGLSLSPEIAD